jgi:hypothetical protein
MTTAMDPRRTAVEAADPQLAALVARQREVVAAIERRAVEVVRAWLIEHGRTWLAVEFTKTRPESPFDGDAALAAAVATLPRRAYGCGLDVRGSFIVRLADLNAFLSRAHDDDAAAALQGPRLELVLVRDPDGDTDATLFVDGVEIDDCDEYVIDAGRGYTFGDWTESRDDAVAAASPAAAALLAASFDYPPGHQYIDDAPEGWPFEDSEAR